MFCETILRIITPQVWSTGRSPLPALRDSTALPSYLHKVVEEVDPLLQRLLQVLAEGQVLGVVADLLHAPPLRLLRGLLGPVLVVVISVLAAAAAGGGGGGGG